MLQILNHRRTAEAARRRADADIDQAERESLWVSEENVADPALCESVFESAGQPAILIQINLAKAEIQNGRASVTLSEAAFRSLDDWHGRMLGRAISAEIRSLPVKRSHKKR